MKESYDDIISRIKEKPLWYDSNGVPRYDNFNPGMCPNIYADEVILLRISCQNCEEEFVVELHADLFGRTSYRRQFEDWFRHNRRGPIPIHYGDPPRHDDPAGNTMNCNDLEVVEFWHKDEKHNWVRNEKYEITFDD